ncbi:uncharacterized protein LOC119657516 [Hermetia illucens]|uniref:uncharacterized protein LOC119657516 n=1 Tax=Hermetia illucens TaxID=343691 RepID=UPI0018CC70C9|nr:uncharacterized protein LOC119657516 [Hermetia illucens]
MIINRPEGWLTYALFILILACFVKSHPLQEAVSQEGDSVDCDPLTAVENGGDEVDVILIGEDEDPRGVVMRRWRRLFRNTIFRPGRYFRRIVTAMILPGTIAGAISGTVASSLVGVGAGGVTGVIAGAGLGGIGGLLVPGVRRRSEAKNKNSQDKSKVSDLDEKGNKEDSVEKDEEGDEDEDYDDSEDEDDNEDLGRNAPFGGSSSNDNSGQMLLFLRGGINVDRLYELRQKMKLLKIKKKFKTKTRHYLWN